MRLLPKRGLNFRLLKLSEINAEQYFKTIYDEDRLYFSIAEEIAKLVNLDNLKRNLTHRCVNCSNRISGRKRRSTIADIPDKIGDWTILSKEVIFENS